MTLHLWHIESEFLIFLKKYTALECVNSGRNVHYFSIGNYLLFNQFQQEMPGGNAAASPLRNHLEIEEWTCNAL